MNYIYEIAGRKINLSQLCWIDDTSYIEFGRVDFGFCMKDNGLPVSDSSVMVLSFSPTGQEMTHKPCKIYSRVDGLYREDGSISWNADGGDHPYPITGDTLFEKRIKEEVGFLVVQWNLVQQDINSRQVS